MRAPDIAALKSFTRLSELEASFTAVGCNRLHFKALAAKQDNDKNQIYLGTDESLLHSWPGITNFRSPSTSRAKRGAHPGRPKLERTLDFWWLWPSRPAAHAPHTRLINYFQYPEIRLSGFIRGCEAPPDALKRNRLSAYGPRWLVIGISSTRVYGAVVDATSFVDTADLERPAHRGDGRVLHQLLLLPRSTLLDHQDLLMRKLRYIGRRWHMSQTLTIGSDAARPFRGSQGAEHTLRALTGLESHTRPKPEMPGLEIKSFSGRPISLVTTEADHGVRAEAGFDAFMTTYGSPDDGSPHIRRFAGLHSTHSTNTQTGLRLRVTNWDLETGRPSGSEPPALQLLDEQRRVVAAGWSLDHLARAWAEKHVNAIYVRTSSRRDQKGLYPTHYQFGPDAIIAEGTDILRFLHAVAIGEIYLDPRDVYRRNGVSRHLTQWRIRSGTTASLARRLQPLYRTVRIATL